MSKYKPHFARLSARLADSAVNLASSETKEHIWILEKIKTCYLQRNLVTDVFDYGHCSRCEVGSNCGFCLHFPKINDTEHISQFLTVNLMGFLPSRNWFGTHREGRETDIKQDKCISVMNLIVSLSLNIHIHLESMTMTLFRNAVFTNVINVR